VNSGIRAAVEVARTRGFTSEDPLLIQETNNTVVWLRPHQVVAKVGVHAGSEERIVREHEVASALVVAGAPIAPPISDAPPLRDVESDFVVTLWNRVDHDPNAESTGDVVGRSLGQLHEALLEINVDVPSFREGLRRTQAALADDGRTVSLAIPDRHLLRSVFTDLLAKLDGFSFVEQGLHGEPHVGNYLVTTSGLRWIDFEDACRGPLEWDLAFLPADAVATFENVDSSLLELLTTLNSARVATWCLIQARFPKMRAHGEYHLEQVRERWKP